MKKKHLLLILLMTLLAPWAVAQQSLPYSYGFEDNDLSIDGWSLVGSTSSSTGINSVAKHNGTYGFQFYYSEHGAYLMSPQLSGTGTGLAVAFYYAEATNSYGDEQFYVGYTTDATNTDPTTFTYGGIETASVSWQLYENTLPANVQRIAIKYVYNDALKLYLDDFTFAVPASCSKPSGLAATLTPGNGTIATLNWTAGGEETAWVLEYGTTSDFTGATSVNVSGTPEKPLTGLTAETKYYARVKADCGGDTSEWSTTCEFTPTNALSLTVNDGTVTNAYVPVYGYYTDNTQRSEFIIPASALTTLSGDILTSMKFYPNYSYSFTGSFKVYLKEVAEETFSGTTYYTEEGATTVYTGALTCSSTEGMSVTFSEEFEYGGGNLLVGCYLATGVSGNYSPSGSSFYGVTASGASISHKSSDSPTQRNFLPKVTIGFESNAYPKPKNLAVSNLTAHTATIGWTAPNTDVQNYKYQYREEGGTWSTLTSTKALSAPLTGLADNTTFEFQVKAIYSSGESEFATTSFTTEEACPAPTNFGVTTITADDATLSWDGSASSYTLKYAAWPSSKGASNLKFADVIKNKNHKATDLTNAQAIADPNTKPNSNTIANQTRDGWYYYDNGTYSTSFGAGGSMFWAVMFPAGSYTGNMLTKIAVWEDSDNNTQPITVYVCDGTATAPENVLYMEEFDVVAEDNFHVVTLASAVEIDPTQNLWLVLSSSDNYPIGTFSSSTATDANSRWCSFDGSSWYDLADVGGDNTYGWMVRAYTETLNPSSLTWTTVNNITTNTYEITNLTADTRYVAQVQANCGSEGNSDWASTYFTTLPSCVAPTNLNYTTFTAHTVTLGWTENGSATAWDIEVTGPTTYNVNATTNPYTVSGLTDNTTYSFKVRAKCSDVDFSDWSNHVVVTTDIACYAPENLTLNDIDAHSANLTWDSNANSCDLRYAVVPDVTSTNWLVYDNGTYSTSIGSSSSSERTWGVMYPATMLGSNTKLSTLAFYETGTLESNVTIKIYQGGTESPTTLIHTDVVNPLTDEGWHVAPLSNAVTIDPTQNLWISLTATGVYPMPACTVNDYNNRWVCNNGEWAQLASSLSDYGWMIRAYLGTMDWVTVPNLTTYDYTMDNLDPETTYVAQVRSNCKDAGEGYSWWSDITFTTESACPAQDELAIEEVGTDYAIISWNAHGYDEGWNLRYSTDEATWIDITKEVTNPYTLADLTSNTKYYVQVQTKCNTDLWSSSLSFKTDCGVMTITPSVTIDEDFEGYTGTTYNTEGVVPDCWTSYSTNTTMPDPHIVGSGSYHYVHDGTNSLNFEANGGKNAYVALPEFTNDFEYLQVQFWMQTESSSSDYKLSLGYITAADNNYDTYQVIEEFEPNTGSMVYHVVYLGIKNVPAEATRLVFRWANSGSSFYACAIDDVFVGLAPAILPVGTLTYNSVQATSVKLSWELLDVTQDLWQVQYATDAGFTQNVGTADADTNENFLLEGLTAETHYYVRVRGQKEYQGYGDWSNTVDFETMPACSAANVTFENITHHNATVNWNGESSDGFTVYYSQATSFDPDHTVINEGFEAGEMPTGWTIEGDNQDASKTWRVGIGDYSTSTGTHSGNYNALITHNTKGNVTYLVTPTLDLSSLTNGKINVWYVNRSWSGDNDEFGVYYRVDGGAWNEIFATTDTHPTWTELFVNLPADALVANCQFGFKMTDNYGYGVGIDDIKVGQMLEATWQTKTTSSTTTDLTGLEAGTQYEVYVVPQCNPASHSATESFTTIASDQKYFLTAGDWATTTNWMDGEIPTITDNAIINANVNVTGTAVVKGINLNYNVLTVASGATLTINGTVTNGGSDKIIIEDGGQLIHNTSIYATVKKNITAPAVWKGTSDADGWYLIATPVSSTTISSTFDGTIDLFKYNEATAYWWSYNNGGSGGGNSFTTIDRGTGYLHASQTSQTVNYAGSMISTESSESIPLSYACSSTDVKGFNLVGNPFTRNLVLGDMSIGSNPVTTIYVIKDEDRTKLTAVTTDEYEVKPGEGFFVQATALNQMVKLNPSAKDEFEFRYIKIVAGNENGSDNAYIQLENGNTLNKMNIANKTSVYVVDGGENLAATTINELAGSMPVNFKATAEDVYTITINTKNIEASTMILLDNMTGEEIDLLATPSYSFKATPNDSEDRFRLIFDCNTYTGIDEFFTDEIFAFQSGSEIYVKGEGTLEVFDVMGRMVLNTRINGVERVNVPANAVYIFKLEEKTQKIVVR